MDVIRTTLLQFDLLVVQSTRQSDAAKRPSDVLTFRAFITWLGKFFSGELADGTQTAFCGILQASICILPVTFAGDAFPGSSFHSFRAAWRKNFVFVKPYHASFARVAHSCVITRIFFWYSPFAFVSNWFPRIADLFQVSEVVCPTPFADLSWKNRYW